MKQIPLTRGLVAIVDDEDYARLSHFKWYALYGRGACYAAHTVSQKPYKVIPMHRLILYAPSRMEVDHANGDTLDNRRCNLRLASRAQNARNSKIHRTNKSGYKGVDFRKRERRWRAQIMFQGKTYHLGYFDTAELAAQAYDAAARMAFGKFARTNFHWLVIRPALDKCPLLRPWPPRLPHVPSFELPYSAHQAGVPRNQDQRCAPGAVA